MFFNSRWFTPLPEDILTYLPPIVFIDKKGVINWSNRTDNNIKPYLPVGASIGKIISELNPERLADKENIFTTVIDGISYDIRIYPLLTADVLKGYAVFFDNYSNINKQINNYMEENEILTMLINVPYTGAIYVDTEGTIKLVNDTFANYVKIKKENLIGHKLEEFKIDPGLLNVIKTKKPDLLAFYPHPKLIATRQPVFKNGEIIGAFGQYISIDLDAIRKHIFEAEEYIDIISRLQARDIMFYVNQFMVELNSYKDEFLKTHTASMGIDNIKGKSLQIQDLKTKILMVANSPSSVLITGESGTGKELVAEAVHFHSSRASRPFIKVNCAAIPENLLESELFGYVDGAFTGARKRGKMGKFEMADQGTIFLDEIGDMPLSMQAKLLRVLQEREIERVGDNKTIPVNVRIISATNKNLQKLVNEGRFRLDLYYRLNVVNLHIPPLRERAEDIPLIAHCIIQELNRKLGHNINNISPEAMKILISYDWPGNVRELINVLEASMNFCQAKQLKTQHLPFSFRSHNPSKSDDSKLKSQLDKTEKKQIEEILKINKGDRKATAAMLGVSRTTLYRMMKKHGLI